MAYDIVVTIDSATVDDLGHDADAKEPDVVAQVSDFWGTKYLTSSQGGTRDPEWGETFTFCGTPVLDTLFFQVVDNDGHYPDLLSAGLSLQSSENEYTDFDPLGSLTMGLLGQNWVQSPSHSDRSYAEFSTQRFSGVGELNGGLVRYDGARAPGCSYDVRLYVKVLRGFNMDGAGDMFWQLADPMCWVHIEGNEEDDNSFYLPRKRNTNNPEWNLDGTLQYSYGKSLVIDCKDDDDDGDVTHYSTFFHSAETQRMGTATLPARLLVAGFQGDVPVVKDGAKKGTLRVEVELTTVV